MCHTLTGVWVEMASIEQIQQDLLVTPSRVCELKCRVALFALWWALVTPSRVCELKFAPKGKGEKTTKSHPHGCVSWNYKLPRKSLRPLVTPSRVCELKLYSYSLFLMVFTSHPHGCVSWNSLNDYYIQNLLLSHPHGCVSWNSLELNQFCISSRSHPHGCVSWNYSAHNERNDLTSHTLTGVWVEMPAKMWTP